MSNQRIPPIIDSYVKGMLTENNTLFVRDNYALMLEGIRDHINDELQKFYSAKAKKLKKAR